MTLRNYLFGIVEFEEDRYILSAGRWGVVNQTFLDEVEKKLRQIDIDYLDQSSVEYFIPYRNEAHYIKSIYNLGGHITLDQKFVYVNDDYENNKENKIELADSYNITKDELMAIKLGK